LQFFQY